MSLFTFFYQSDIIYVSSIRLKINFCSVLFSHTNKNLHIKKSNTNFCVKQIIFSYMKVALTFTSKAN